jgi:predicted amidohydrolase
MARQVTVAAVSAGIEASVASRPMTQQENVDRTARCIERLSPMRPDLIALTECFHCAGVPGRYDELAVRADDDVIERIAMLASKLGVHIACPIMERRGDLTFNCALWIDRQGKIAGRYDKIHPTESEIDLGVTCGLAEPTVWEMDFGRVGVQTCFDINWPAGWEALTRAGVELIVWPSAYGGGRQLAAHAFLNQCYVLTATWPKLCRAYDISGDVLEECGRLGDFVVQTIDLERRLFHWDYQGDRIDRIRSKYGPAVVIDIYHEEGWFAINGTPGSPTVAELIKEFDLVPLDAYFSRATARQAEHRPTRPEPE